MLDQYGCVENINGTDALDFINLLNFLEGKGVITIKDTSRLEDILDEWCNLEQV